MGTVIGLVGFVWGASGFYLALENALGRFFPSRRGQRTPSWAASAASWRCCWSWRRAGGLRRQRRCLSLFVGDRRRGAHVAARHRRRRRHSSAWPATCWSRSSRRRSGPRPRRPARGCLHRVLTPLRAHRTLAVRRLPGPGRTRLGVPRPHLVRLRLPGAAVRRGVRPAADDRGHGQGGPPTRVSGRQAWGSPHRRQKRAWPESGRSQRGQRSDAALDGSALGAAANPDREPRWLPAAGSSRPSASGSGSSPVVAAAVTTDRAGRRPGLSSASATAAVAAAAAVRRHASVAAGGGGVHAGWCRGRLDHRAPRAAWPRGAGSSARRRDRHGAAGTTPRDDRARGHDGLQGAAGVPSPPHGLAASVGRRGAADAARLPRRRRPPAARGRLGSATVASASGCSGATTAGLDVRSQRAGHRGPLGRRQLLDRLCRRRDGVGTSAA